MLLLMSQEANIIRAPNQNKESKDIFFFASSNAEATKFIPSEEQRKSILGGKGKGLAEMSEAGLPVPQGFTIGTHLCQAYYNENKKFPEALRKQIWENLARLKKESGQEHGDDLVDPFTVSVRSGARDSMPGMMDTILNVGLNDEIVAAWKARIPEASAFIDNSYARLKEMYKQTVGKELPQKPAEQFLGAIEAVWQSWQSGRAIAYRNNEKIDHNTGTAVSIVRMVYGNRNLQSGTGVIFTRDPKSGEKQLIGEILFIAQGEDVVAGIRKGMPLALLNASLEQLQKDTEISKLLASSASQQKLSVEEVHKQWNALYEDICRVSVKLEAMYKDVQDIEFTVDNGKLWLLQTRNAKRSPEATLKIAYDLYLEGVIDRKTYLNRVPPATMNLIHYPVLDETAKKEAIAKNNLLSIAIAVGGGAAVGEICFDVEDVTETKMRGRAAILVRHFTSAHDYEAMTQSAGLYTATGGSSSHSAIVAMQMNKPAVVGDVQLQINEKNKTCIINNRPFKRGDLISIDGNTGEVFAGNLITTKADLSKNIAYQAFTTLVSEIRYEYKAMSVQANADNPESMKAALAFGAEAVGVVRTEHMFIEEDKILDLAYLMSLLGAEADTPANQKQHDWEGRQLLGKIKTYQRDGFVENYRIMQNPKGNPLLVTIRLLDPPAHEFIPQNRLQWERLSKRANVSIDILKARFNKLHEENPMMGVRGIRLDSMMKTLFNSGIYQAQIEAIFEAASQVSKEIGKPIIPKLHVPMVALVEELQAMQETIHKIAKSKGFEKGSYLIGATIATPAACIQAGRIAKLVDYFSVGTNDLTQATLLMSRDDTQQLIKEYVRTGYLKANPFTTIEPSVKELVTMAIERGRKGNPNLIIGIAGEQAFDPDTILQLATMGFDYISGSPARIQAARVATAQAAVNLHEKEIAERTFVGKIATQGRIRSSL